MKSDESTMKSRRDTLVELINREGLVSISKMKETFPDVSDMTLRRDLDFLDNHHQIIRIHGGAKSVQEALGSDGQYIKRSSRNTAAKQLIAEKSVTLLNENTSIFLDSGTTATAFARVFPDKAYMVFTSGISCAMELAHLSQSQVHLLGGRMDRYSLSVSGPRAFSSLSMLNFHIAFLCTTGYIPDRGFTCEAEDAAHLKHEVLRRADKVVLMMDSKKVGITSTYTFADLSDIDVLVTDGELSGDIIALCEKQHVQVL